MTIKQFMTEIEQGTVFAFAVYGKEYGISSCVGKDYFLYLIDDKCGEIPFKIGISDPTLTNNNIFNTVDDLLSNYKINGMQFKDILKDVTDWRNIPA